MKKTILLSIFLLCAALKISNAQSQCNAVFFYNINGNVVQFYDTSWTSSGSITSWTWSFGDGGNSTQQSPIHTYSQTGTYMVCLTIQTSMGCSDSTCNVITIGNPCNLTATIAYDSLANSLTANATGGTAPYYYYWSTGDTSATIYVSVAGTYCVTVTDINNCTANACYNYNTGNCNAMFSYLVNGNDVQFTNASSGNYSSVLWVFGDGGTSTQSNPLHTYPNGVWTPCLYLLDSIGNTLCQYCTAITVVNTTPTDTICGQIFIDTNGNGVMDAGESGYSGIVYLYGNGLQFTVSSDSLGHYEIPVPAGTYSVYFCASQLVTFTVPLADSSGCAFYDSVTVSSGGMACGYNFGFQYNSVTITGTVFLDANNNGIFDAGETGAPYQPVQVGSYTTYTNGNGEYTIWVVPGTYTITYTPSGMFAGYTLSTPGTLTVNAAVAGNTYGGNNFGIYLPPGSTNLSVTITPHTTVTPGFPAWYDVMVCNIGSQATGATLIMGYDPGLTFNYSSPPETSINTTTHVITWNVPTILPGNCVSYWVDFDASTSLTVGDNTFEFVNVTPNIGIDTDLSNNTDTVHQVVTSSWDPNNKLVAETNTNDPAFQVISSVNPDQSIEYTINFQNLGTSAAVNIVVLDQLSADLDANSFVLINTSHNAIVNRNGSMLNFNFSNIMLPPASVNQAASHGYITFRVNSLNGLAVGHVISDNADIYFDFNSPVATNYAIVTMIDPTGIESNNPAASFQLSNYPNPFNSSTTIEYVLDKSAYVQLDMYDAAGNKTGTLVNEDQVAGAYHLKLNAGNLSKGIYLLKMQVNGNSSYHKIVFY